MLHPMRHLRITDAFSAWIAAALLVLLMIGQTVRFGVSIGVTAASEKGAVLVPAVIISSLILISVWLLFQ